ncbi:MAG: hypothetical protein ACKERG_01260 [Candidatus Hodgkinia cicadicola]
MYHSSKGWFVGEPNHPSRRIKRRICSQLQVCALARTLYGPVVSERLVLWA